MQNTVPCVQTLRSRDPERACILASSVTDIPVPARYSVAGYHPTAYRVTYDAQAKEYRIALAQLVAHPQWSESEAAGRIGPGGAALG
ncbi:MAG TPA: hypothetical protein VGR27_13835 [Longimicrobiaceae bacterium]|nr:hypothetical protein [Longimicrobiaceae bacterium]